MSGAGIVVGEANVNPYADHPVIEALKESGVFPVESKYAYETAEQFDVNVILPRDNELQIDIDNNSSMEIFNRVLPVLESRFGDVKLEKHSSRSGGLKYHITVTLEKNVVSPMERILLQACLGSDPVRELLSYYRVLDSERPATLFFEPKPKKDISIEYGHKYVDDGYGLCSSCSPYARVNANAKIHQTFKQS